MAVLEIKKYPERVLKQKASPVEKIDENTLLLINNMIETMHLARGIGLAANQIGILKRICVIDLASRVDTGSLMVLINPLIVEKEGQVEAEEGCLSIPGYMATIKRAEKILVKGLNMQGRDIEIEGSGLLSRVLQHEIDHLDGFLFIDRMNPVRREFFKRRYKKMQKATVQDGL
ncbi:MAG: peptide deformylase [Nitrospirota bacterium]